MILVVNNGLYLLYLYVIILQSKNIGVFKRKKVIVHYDSLIDENNDPCRDPKPLQDYMDKWDGKDFINSLYLSKDKSVLEIGICTYFCVQQIIKSRCVFTSASLIPCLLATYYLLLKKPSARRMAFCNLILLRLSLLLQ